MKNNHGPPACDSAGLQTGMRTGGEKPDVKITISSVPPSGVATFKLFDAERLALPLPSDPGSEQVVMVFVCCHLGFSSGGIPFSNEPQSAAPANSEVRQKQTTDFSMMQLR